MIEEEIEEKYMVSKSEEITFVIFITYFLF